ncbi:MAG: GTP 3',8-cyclase MoaA [Tepidisphaeraceae bacterium]
MLIPLVNSSAPHFDTGPRSIRAVKVLRISVTDRCNFRCVYCMPETGVTWLPRDELLSFEEIGDIARAAAELHGITRFKLTGGEPTVRAGLTDLIALLRRRVPTMADLSLTTNGFCLETLATPLHEAGLDRVTVSVDSLNAERFKRVTRTGDLPTVLRGLDRAIDAGFRSVKINCVAMRGTNDDEFAAFAKLAIDRPVTVRFIEYMPLGDSALLAQGNPFVQVTTKHGTHFESGPAHGSTPVLSEVKGRIASDEQGPSGGCGAQDRGDVFVPEQDIRAAIEREHGPLAPVDRNTEAGVGPAVPYEFVRHPNALGRVAFISAMSAPFCATCNRLRLTATGILRSCLFDGGEVDLKPIVRTNASAGRDVRIAHAMERCVAQKPEVHGVRGTEQMSRIGG